MQGRTSTDPELALETAASRSPATISAFFLGDAGRGSAGVRAYNKREGRRPRNARCTHAAALSQPQAPCADACAQERRDTIATNRQVSRERTTRAQDVRAVPTRIAPTHVGAAASSQVCAPEKAPQPQAPPTQLHTWRERSARRRPKQSSSGETQSPRARTPECRHERHHLATGPLFKISR